MNFEEIKSKIDKYFNAVTPNEIISRFKKFGYKFEKLPEIENEEFNDRKIHKIEWGNYFNQATTRCPHKTVEYDCCSMIPMVNSVACKECKHYKGIENFYVLCDF